MNLLIIFCNPQFIVIELSDKYLIIIELNVQLVMHHIKILILLIKLIIINGKDQLI